MADDTFAELTVGLKQLSSLRVIDLKTELEKRGLPKSGSKKELLERLKRQLQLENLHQKSSQNEDHVPNLSLQDDARVSQNEVVKQYLAGQQRIYELQKEARRKIEQDDAYRASDTEASSSQDEGPSTKDIEQNQTEDEMPRSQESIVVTTSSTSPNVKLKVSLNVKKIHDETMDEMSGAKHVSYKISETVTDSPSIDKAEKLISTEVDEIKSQSSVTEEVSKTVIEEEMPLKSEEVKEEMPSKPEAVEEVKDELALAVGSICMDRDAPLDLSEHTTIRMDQSASPVFVDRAEMDRAALEAMEAAAILENQIASSQEFATDIEVPVVEDTTVSSSDGINLDGNDKSVISLGQESAEGVDEVAEACRIITQSFIQEETQNEKNISESDSFADVRSSQIEESETMGRIRRSQTKAEAENTSIDSPTPPRKYSLRGEKHTNIDDKASVSDNIPDIPLPEGESIERGKDDLKKCSKSASDGSRSPSPDRKAQNNTVKRENSNSPERKSSPVAVAPEIEHDLPAGTIKREIRSPSRVQLRSPSSQEENNFNTSISLVKSEDSVSLEQKVKESTLKVENPLKPSIEMREDPLVLTEVQPANVTENMVKFEGPALPVSTEKASSRSPSPSKKKENRLNSKSPSPSKSHGRSPKIVRSKSRSPSPSRRKSRHSIKANSKSPSPAKPSRRPRLKRGKKSDSRSPSPSKRSSRSSKRGKSRSASPPRRRDRRDRSKKKLSRSPSPHRHRDRSPKKKRSRSRTPTPPSKRRDKSPKHKKSKSRSQSPLNRKGKSLKHVASKSRTPSPPKSRFESVEPVVTKSKSLVEPKVTKSRSPSPDTKVDLLSQSAKTERKSSSPKKDVNRSSERVPPKPDVKDSSSEKSDEDKEATKLNLTQHENLNNSPGVAAMETGDIQKDSGHILDLHPGDMDISENPIRTSEITNNEDKDDKSHKKSTSSSDQHQHSHHPRNLSNRKLSLSGSRDSKEVAKEDGKPQRKRRWGSLAKTSKFTPSISTESLKDLIPDYKPQLSALPEDFEQSPPSPSALLNAGDSTHDKSEGPTDKKHREGNDGVKVESSRVIQLERRRISSTNSGPPAPQMAAALLPSVHINSGPAEIDGKATGDARAPSPAKNSPSQILYIRNLVRPFTLPQLKEMLGRTGSLVPDAFWIDKIKSKCYVMYDNQEEAGNTRNALHGSRWPVSNPKTLLVDYSTEDELNFHKQLGDSPGLPPPPVVPVLHRSDSHQRGEENFPQTHRLAKNMTVVVSQDVLAASTTTGRAPPIRQHREESDRGRTISGPETGRPERLLLPVREWDRDKLTQEPTPHGHRHHHHHHKEPGKGTKGVEGELHPPVPSDRERKERSSRREKKEIIKKKIEEPPGKLLDDLFKKTKSIPCIYWLPLTDAALALREVEKKQWEVEREKRREKRQETGGPDVGSSGERRPPRQQREALKPLPPPMLTGGNVAPLKGRDFSGGRNLSPPGRRH